ARALDACRPAERSEVGAAVVLELELGGCGGQPEPLGDLGSEGGQIGCWRGAHDVAPWIGGTGSGALAGLPSYVALLEAFVASGGADGRADSATVAHGGSGRKPERKGGASRRPLVQARTAR